jgi:transcriptional regulator with XRE-family HTH domain
MAWRGVTVSLGSHLRQMRLSRGLSIRALAHRARVSPSTLSRWESGSTSPRVYELEAVLTALQASGSERASAWQQLHRRAWCGRLQPSRCT